jgi:hypothetical protein
MRISLLPNSFPISSAMTCLGELRQLTQRFAQLPSHLDEIMPILMGEGLLQDCEADSSAKVEQWTREGDGSCA